jgi:hypothetical protein
MQPFIKKLQQSIDYLLSKVTGIEKDVKTLENTVSNLPTSSSSGIEISNWVIVNQASDLPATLAANTTYVVVGEVTTSQQVTVTNDNTSIIGFDRDKDGLVYTGTGNFITVTDVNFAMDRVKISTPTGNVMSASNISVLSPPTYGRNKVLTITNCQFRNCLNGLEVSGFDLVDISNSIFQYFTGAGGNTFASVSKLEITSCEMIRWYDEATQTTYSTGFMIDLLSVGAAPFGAVNINSSIIHPQQTQNGINIRSGSITNVGTISSNAFVSSGLTTGVVFSPVAFGLPNYSDATTETYDVFANQGILNSTSGTVMTLLGNTTSTALGGGDPNPNVINTGGGAVQQAGVRYTVSAAGRATYTGSKQAYVSIHASLSFTKQGGGTDDYTFYIYKNGSLLNGSGTDIVSGGATANGQLTMVYGTLMNQNDYIEIYVENVTNTNNMLVKDFQIVIRE